MRGFFGRLSTEANGVPLIYELGALSLLDFHWVVLQIVAGDSAPSARLANYFQTNFAWRFIISTPSD